MCSHYNAHPEPDGKKLISSPYFYAKKTNRCITKLFALNIEITKMCNLYYTYFYEINHLTKINFFAFPAIFLCQENQQMCKDIMCTKH